MVRIAFLFVLSIIISIDSFSQVVIEPLESNDQLAEGTNTRRLKTAALGDTLKLPFWDDFTLRHDSLWLTGGGVYFNNNYCYDQPNMFVASFDGLKANGKPYVPLAIGGKPVNGPADTLTSKPIDLSSYVQGNKLYLRFSWQAGGLGDAPDLVSDSICLQFKNSVDQWISVWNKNNVPQVDDSTFFHQFITIEDAQFFHNGFQFRFQSFGKLSGNFDVWNIDYVMLDENKLAADSIAPDISYVRASTSLLKNYTSIPLKQFEANKDNELADTIFFLARSLNFELKNYTIVDSTSYIKNISIPEVFQDLTTQFIPNFTKPYQTRPQVHQIQKDLIDLNHQPTNIAYQSTISPNDATIGDSFPLNSVESTVSRLNFNINNQFWNYTPISNYYSYDDGTAEVGFGVTTNLGRVAVKYHMNVPDTITGLKICFPSLNTEYENSSIVLLVMTGINNGSSNQNILYKESVPMKHPSGLNGFYEYTFTTPLFLNLTNADFFVGYQQTSTNKILVGFDKNTDSRGNIFFRTSTNWQEFDDEPGSVMIRPIFGNRLVTGTTPAITTLDAAVYPNPTTGIINITGKIAKATLYDLTGREVQHEDFDSSDAFSTNSLDASNLQNGLYLLHLENENAREIKKIIIAK